MSFSESKSFTSAVMSPKMKLTRIIHPVGQGGFYTETLRQREQEVNIVYDCGGYNRGEKKMKNYLDSYLFSEKTKKKIEAVFISHLHADHINGLQYLLDNAEVKYLFLPQLSDNIFLEAFLYNFCLTGNYSHVNQFLMHLYNGDRTYGDNEIRTKIIQANPANDNRLPEDFNMEEIPMDSPGLNAWDWEQGKSINLSSIDSISANTLLCVGKWFYIPYNSEVDSQKVKDLKDKLGKALNAPIDVANLPTMLKTLGVNKCKNIYKEVFGNEHNSYSMTLFSGTLENTMKNHCRMCPDCLKHHCCHTPFCCNPNILYTGDFEPNHVQGLQNYYGHWWNKIAAIQIPHHGSKNNYEENLYEYPLKGFVSVGNNNSFCHPDIDTLIKIQNQGCHPIIVTEDKSSMQISQYSVI